MDAFMGGKNAMSEKRPVGRPKGEASTIVNIRVPLSLLARLDRYVDHQEVTTGRSTNRAIVMKNALRTFSTSRDTNILTCWKYLPGGLGGGERPQGPLTARGVP